MADSRLADPSLTDPLTASSSAETRLADPTSTAPSLVDSRLADPTFTAPFQCSCSAYPASNRTYLRTFVYYITSFFRFSRNET